MIRSRTPGKTLLLIGSLLALGACGDDNDVEPQSDPVDVIELPGAEIFPEGVAITAEGTLFTGSITIVSHGDVQNRIPVMQFAATPHLGPAPQGLTLEGLEIRHRAENIFDRCSDIFLCLQLHSACASFC